MKKLEAMTLQKQQAHLMPRSWFLIPLSRKRNQGGLPGDLAEFMTGAENIHDVPIASGGARKQKSAKNPQTLH